jgi:methionine-rich copper-binding protein CopC
MRHLPIALFALLAPLALTSPAAAHVSVSATSIADNAVLAGAPSAFTVTFSGRTGLASVVLANGDGARIPLRYVRPRAPTTSFTIPLPPLAAGQYTLTWRAMSPDGHVVSGAVQFRIAG